jgi:hypothetical protein
VGSWQDVFDLPAGFDSVFHWHQYIHDDNVWRQGLCHLHGNLSVAGVANDLVLAGAFQDFL